MAPHLSVLLDPVLESFKDLEINTFVDGTLGAAGHSRAILEAHPEIEKLIGFDQDPSALAIAKERLAGFEEKCELVHANFSEMAKQLKAKGIEGVDGILLDLGISSMHVDQPERGFSFREDGPLDMRMNPEQKLTAAEVVNTWESKDLGRIFRNYGEERAWRGAAEAICRARAVQPIETTQQLVAVLNPVLARWAKKGINPCTKVFQALRICVNGELDVLEKVLPDAMALLRPGGRLAIISFHSLEDRMVKQSFRYAASDKEQDSGLAGLFIDKEPLVRLVTRKPVSADAAEIQANPRSRSARLRVVEKL